jgi:hypothetical protein
MPTVSNAKAPKTIKDRCDFITMESLLWAWQAQAEFDRLSATAEDSPDVVNAIPTC